MNAEGEAVPSNRDTSPFRFPWPEREYYGLWETFGISFVVFFCAYYAGSLAEMLARALTITDRGTIWNYLASEVRSPTVAAMVGQDFPVAIRIIATASFGVALLWFVTSQRGCTDDYMGAKLPRAAQVSRHCLWNIAVILALLGMETIRRHTSGHGIVAPLFQTSSFPLLLGLAVVFEAPLFEESLFRGFLFSGIARSTWGPRSAIAITAILWTLGHVGGKGSLGLLVTFGLGMYFGWLRLRTGSIWLPLILHSLWNGMSFIKTLILLRGGA